MEFAKSEQTEALIEFTLAGMAGEAAPAILARIVAAARVAKTAQNTMKTFGVSKEWVKADGTLRWPTNDGFEGLATLRQLKPGEIVDRFGSPEQGQFMSPIGTSFEARALPPTSIDRTYYQYKVLKPLPVQEGKVASWFDQPGGGTQYKVDDDFDIQQLIDDGYLEEVK